MHGTVRRRHRERIANVVTLWLPGLLAVMALCGCSADGGARDKAQAGDKKVLAVAAATEDVLLRKALEAAAGAADGGQRGRLLVAIARAQAEAGDAGGALRTAGVIETAEHKAAALAEAAVALAKGGEKERAQETLASARKLSAEGDGDVAKLLVVARAYLGDVEGALEEAEKWEFDKPLEKLPWLKSLAGAARAAADDKQNKRFLDDALAIVESMQEVGNDVLALTLLATLQSAASDDEAAHEALKQALDKARSLPVEDRPMQLLAVATAQGRIEGVDAAKPIFAEALDASGHGPFGPLFLWQMAGFQAEVGDTEGAMETTDLIRVEMSDSDDGSAAHASMLTADCWAQIAKAQARGGDWVVAEATLGRVPPALEVELKDDDALTAAFSAVVLTIGEAMATLGHRDQAIELIGRVDEVDMRVMAFLAAYRGERSRRQLLIKAPVTLSLKVVGRFASGHSWQLDVDPGGTAQLAIKDFGKPIERKFTVSAKQLDELREVLIDQRFFELGGEYGQRVPDGSTRTMSVSLGELKTTVTLVFLSNWLSEDPSKVVEPARALRVWALVRGWFKDGQAVDLRKYDQRIIDAADAVDGGGRH